MPPISPRAGPLLLLSVALVLAGLGRGAAPPISPGDDVAPTPVFLAVSKDGKTSYLGVAYHCIEKEKATGWTALWRVDLTTGKILARTPGPRGYAWGGDISPDLKTVAWTFMIEGEGSRAIFFNIRRMDVHFWDAATGTETGTIKRENPSPYSAGFTPDGKTYCLIEPKKPIEFWDVRTGKRRAVLKGTEHEEGGHCLAPDGTWIACPRDNDIVVWDVATGERRAVLRGHKKAVNALAVSPDGKTLASAALDGTIKWWDVEKARLIHSTKDWGGFLCFSPDGKTLASTEADDAQVYFWDVMTGKRRGAGRFQKDVVGPSTRGTTFTPDGKILMRTCHDLVELLDVPAREHVTTLKVGCLAISADGKKLVVTDPKACTIRVWDLVARKHLVSYELGR